MLPGGLYQYVDNLPGTASLTINGKPVTAPVRNGYATLERVWQKNDVIRLSLPMAVRRVIANEHITEDTGQVALEYGPVVYCIESADNPNSVMALQLPDQAPLRVEYRDQLLNGVNVITGTVSVGGKPQLMTAIPYYAWSNRGVGAMKVWLPRQH